MKPTLEQRNKAIHALSPGNGHAVILEAEVIDKVAQAIADERRAGSLEAYEHVADNLTIGKFAMRLNSIKDGERSCMIARDVVYACRDLVLKS